MNVRQLAQHLVDTAPGTSEVLIHVATSDAVVEVPIAHAHVEMREGHLAPVVIVYTDKP